MWKTIEGQPTRREAMTGMSARQLTELVDRVREMVGPDWELPPVGRPHVLPLPAAVVAALFGPRHNMPDEVVAEVFGCCQATITRYHEILAPILRWVTGPERQEQYERAQPNAALVNGFVAPVGEREGYAGLFSGKKHLCGQNVQVVADLGGRVADVGDPVPGSRHDAVCVRPVGYRRPVGRPLRPRRTRHARRRRLPRRRPDHPVPQTTRTRTVRRSQSVQLLDQPSAHRRRAPLPIMLR